MLKNNMQALAFNDVGNISVNSALNFATVALLNRDGCHLIMQGSNSVVFDLEQVASADNAGVAVLISWVHYAKSINKKISFINVPPQLLGLIVASGLDGILPIV